MGDSNHLSAKSIVATATSVAATIMLMRPVINEFLPRDLRGNILFVLGRVFRRFSSSATIVVEEHDGLLRNHLFSSINTYISYRTSSPTSRFKVVQQENKADFDVRVDPDQSITDVFLGVKFRWVMVVTENSVQDPSQVYKGYSHLPEHKSFHVTFPSKHRDLFLNEYLPYISKQAKELMQEKKTIQIHTCRNYGEMWTSVEFDHPSTFDTLALDDGVKDMILSDLNMFVNRKEYFKRVGRVWKRGYLLYGPPGTGKSSLIAAIANRLRFDIYELELTAVQSNSDLKSILLATKNRSILVVEDIDCSLELKDRQQIPEDVQIQNVRYAPQMTLSGFLNCIDGLWASLGDERIIIFTTNHKEKLDPALLRPGRMDVHVHLSYCSNYGFRALANNYIGVKEHALFKEIEEILPGARATPAEVAEHLMRSDDQPEQSLSNLIEFLQDKIERNESGKDEGEDESSKTSVIVRGVVGSGTYFSGYHRRRRVASGSYINY